MLITVMGDYGCWPLWVRADPGEILDTRDPASLGLTVALVGRLAAWQQWVESRVNMADPHDSRDVTPAEQAAFDDEGRLLATRVAAELPDALVHYHRDQPPRQKT